MASKPGVEAFREYLTNLMNQDWIRRSERRVWPRYAFHYSDIRNVVEILKSGRLYSREHLERAGELTVSSGSSEVLASTNMWVKDCVRLYFRPKTPTQYWVEGIRSKNTLRTSKFPDAHCPVPMFLLFDLAEILALPRSSFSDRGLGSQNYQILSTVDDMEQLAWKKIYHNSALPTDSTRFDIVACRNAEIIIPDDLGLESLRFIYCRSEPELETLIHLLPSNIASQYQSRIISSHRSDLFYRQHTYLDVVQLSANEVVFQFSPDTQSNGPFELCVDFSSLSGDTLQTGRVNDFYVRSSNNKYTWRVSPPAQEYEVRITLDNALLYCNSHIERNIPF